MSEWKPDFVISGDLNAHSRVYLDGVLQAECFEARIKYESLQKPVFGELIVASSRDGRSYVPAVFYIPNLGEFEHTGVLVKFVCGQVYAELDEHGKAIVAQIRAGQRFR